MKQARFEHVNLTVLDPDATAQRLVDLFGWTVRWAGSSIHGGRTVHVGTGDDYLALYTLDGTEPLGGDSYHVRLAVNHIGVVVEDLDAMQARVEAAGFEPYSFQDYEPGRRFYFRDGEGLEFEVVAYD